ncbi:hypothetical protein Nepgr_006896 [Nepenthes gracilis]|uniref:Uncharacterized protein n=1 Tax=Nepenthes gracilis TaxID=150966 RepID=A0AAD3XI11_NEPGR|nr:hypothetical protein Nepgr_006896 [Nepenthes gracilis]
MTNIVESIEHRHMAPVLATELASAILAPTTYDRFTAERAPSFLGKPDSVEADIWLKRMKKIFKVVIYEKEVEIEKFYAERVASRARVSVRPAGGSFGSSKKIRMTDKEKGVVLAQSMTDSRTSVAQCTTCGRMHPGQACRRMTGACFKCGQKKEMPVLILALLTKHLVRSGCKAYLAYTYTTGSHKVPAKDILVVRNFEDVFPKELPGLPSHGRLSLRSLLFPMSVQFLKLLIE